MMFAQPWILILLILPGMALAWIWRRTTGRVAVPFDHAGHQAGTPMRVAINVAESIPSLLLAVTVVLLAGPRRLGEPINKRTLTNVEFCVDVSGSMTSSFGDGDRYDGAMKAIDEFVHFRKGDAFGLTFFGSNVLHWCPLTFDISAITCSTPFMKPDNVPGWIFGGTMIGKALKSCQKILRDREVGDRMVILVTDGMSSDLYGSAGEELAQELKKDGIVVFGILIGEYDIPDEVLNLTRTTGGECFEAGDPEALKTVFNRIDGMKQAKLEKTIAETRDHFDPWCWAGLSLLGVGLLTAFGLRYTPW